MTKSKVSTKSDTRYSSQLKRQDVRQEMVNQKVNKSIDRLGSFEEILHTGSLMICVVVSCHQQTIPNSSRSNVTYINREDWKVVD